MRAYRWEEVKEFVKQHPEAVRVKENFAYRGTALYFAVRKQKVDGVKALLPFMEEKDLEIVSDDGDTVLAAALNLPNDKDGDETNYEIVKCIVEKIQKNKKLFVRHVSHSERIIPVLFTYWRDKPKKLLSVCILLLQSKS